MPTPPSRLDASDFFLRAWSPADALLMRRALDESEAHLRAWTPWVFDGKEPGLTLEERLARHAADFASGREWLYGIFDANGGAVLGGCGLHPRVGPGAIEIGYWLAASATGRGIATAATRLLVDAAFAAPEMRRVEIRVDPGNERSAAVPRRLGFTPSGSVEVFGTTLDVWAMSRDAWIGSDE
jgi:RimJ/RimL family protein N-acetyltransferase